MSGRVQQGDSSTKRDSESLFAYDIKYVCAKKFELGHVFKIR